MVIVLLSTCELYPLLSISRVTYTAQSPVLVYRSFLASVASSPSTFPFTLPRAQHMRISQR